MRKAVRLVCFAAAVYVFLSLLASAVYALSSDSWEVATHRNGLTIVDVDPLPHGCVWLLPPWNNYGDDWHPLF